MQVLDENGNLYFVSVKPRYEIIVEAEYEDIPPKEPSQPQTQEEIIPAEESKDES